MLLKSRIYAGAEKVVIEIMVRMQNEYEFYYVSPYGEIAEKLKGCHLRYFPLRHFRIKEIRQVIASIRPDIIHAHDFSASVAASCLKGTDKSYKLISHIHYNAKENLVWGKKAILYWLALNRIDQVICVSEAIVEEAVFRNALKLKAIVLGNPIDKTKIWKMAEKDDIVLLKKERKKEELYLYNLIFVGRLSKQKNPEKFIRILVRLIQSGQVVRAALVGDGEKYSACCQLIKKYHLENQVEMLGFLENPYSVIKKSQILCMTSEEEGFGLAVAEAMVLGIPVLVSAVGGMKVLLGAEAKEFCKTEQEYVEKAIRLLQDKTFYQKEQQHMKEKAKEFLTVEEYIEQIRNVYKGCFL